jgi:hypothetical protein
VTRLVLLCTTALAVLAVTAAPAAAHEEPAEASAVLCTGWEAEGAAAFDSLGTLAATTVAARGAGSGIVREPTLDATYEALPAGAKGKGATNWKTVTVPTWFHVVHDGPIGNVTDADVETQIRIMNLGYAGFYGGYDQGFRFKLVGITRTDNADWFYGGIDGSSERPMKKALHRGGMDTLNVYSTTAGPYLGWAYLPGLNDSLAYLDGLVIDWESMYKTSTRYAGAFDLGMTAVHEVGHWFGLEHTFFGGCNANGDYVDDTPAQKLPTSGCPADGTQDSCTRSPGLDPIHNFMDYSDDRCYRELTRGQAVRSRDHWLAFRGA